MQDRSMHHETLIGNCICGISNHVVIDLDWPTKVISDVGDLWHGLIFVTLRRSRNSNSIETFHILLLHPDCYGTYL